jgi:hypothetical protein
MQVEGTVLARNKQAGPTVISSDPRSTHFVQWEGAGDPAGGDVQLVPAEIVQTVPFVQAIRKGIIEIENPEDNPALMETLDRQSTAWSQRQAEGQADIRATIESAPNRDLITMKCIGPAARGEGACDADVPMRDVTKYDAPPLCHQHINLAPEYVPTDEGRDEKGRQIQTWSRSAMGRRSSYL